MKRKVLLTFNGEQVSTIIVNYTEYDKTVQLRSEEPTQEYERRTGQCSQKGHIDVQMLLLDTVELSSRTDADTKGTLWHRVRKIHTTMNDYIFSWIALDSKGKKSMQEIIPVVNIDHINIHYKNPNLYKRKREGKIHELNDETIEALK